MWDKSCGYPYHFSCATPTDPGHFLGPVPGSSYGYETRVTPGDIGGLIEIRNWATNEGDDINGRWLQIFALPDATLRQNPYVLFAHGEGAQIEPDVLASFAHSVIHDRNGPQDVRCAALYPSETPSISVTPSISSTPSPTTAPAQSPTATSEQAPDVANTVTATVTVTVRIVTVTETVTAVAPRGGVGAQSSGAATNQRPLAALLAAVICMLLADLLIV
jgi:hypothetical protein